MITQEMNYTQITNEIIRDLPEIDKIISKETPIIYGQLSHPQNYMQYYVIDYTSFQSNGWVVLFTEIDNERKIWKFAIYENEYGHNAVLVSEQLFPSVIDFSEDFMQSYLDYLTVSINHTHKQALIEFIARNPEPLLNISTTNNRFTGEVKDGIITGEVLNVDGHQWYKVEDFITQPLIFLKFE